MPNINKYKAKRIKALKKAKSAFKLNNPNWKPSTVITNKLV